MWSFFTALLAGSVYFIQPFIITFLNVIDSILNSIGLGLFDYATIGVICGFYLTILIVTNGIVYVLSILNLIYVPVQFNWDLLDFDKAAKIPYKTKTKRIGNGSILIDENWYSLYQFLFQAGENFTLTAFLNFFLWPFFYYY